MANYSEGSDEDDDFQEEEVFYEKIYTTIIIDTPKEVFEKRSEVQIELIKSYLKAVDYLIDNIITSNVKTENLLLSLYVGDKLVINYEHNSFESFKIIRNLLEQSVEKLQDEYEKESNFVMIINNAMSQFSKNCKFIDRKMIYYITNCENPVQDDDLRLVAINEAMKFKDLNITFNLMTFSKEFNHNFFYDEFLAVANNGDIILADNEEDMVQQLFNYHNYQTMKRFKIKFYLDSDNPDIFLEQYKVNIVDERKLISNAHVDKRTFDNVVVVNDTEPTCHDDNETYENGAKICQNDTFKSLIMHLSSDQYEDFMRHDYLSGITLLFMSKRVSSDGMALAPAFFMHLTKDSGRASLYNSIWSYCYNNNKVLICLYRAQIRSNSKFVELSPVSYNNTAMFRVLNLPTSEYFDYNLNALKPEAEPTYNAMLDDLSKSLIDKMKIKHSTDKLYDECYRKIVSYVKSKLLDIPEEMVEAPDLNMNFQVDDILQQINMHAVVDTKKNVMKRKRDED